MSVTAYNLPDESSAKNHETIKQLRAVVTSHGLTLEVKVVSEPYIPGLLIPTFVINDEPYSETFFPR